MTQFFNVGFDDDENIKLNLEMFSADCDQY